ncbi:hypothetical protein [Methylocystis echinoides]|uniref:Uncharacterized protein n=1 Tax=Methylocystis echinoides TaxID=29468 RepID=A0A9W6GX40_9HYPH|nr:hypothetical protein [Methylocystis echinoides]GLI94678.1 hypothetical protein LMG27198_36700 [Methylocystis echinoides]
MTQLSVDVDNACPDCQGTGYVASAENPSKVVKCACRVKTEALSYLGALYAHSEWAPDRDVTSWVGRDLLFQKCDEATFCRAVKTFLLLHAFGHRLSHRTATSREVVAAFMAPEGRELEEALRAVDLLFLICDKQPRNSQYSPALTSLIGDRRRHQRPTWIHAPQGISDESFAALYGDDFRHFVQTHFSAVPLKSPSQSTCV